jgi:hypothetical protein
MAVFQMPVVVIAEAIEHKQWEETIAQEPKPEFKSKDDKKLFTQQCISLKPIPFTSVVRLLL